MTKYSDISAPHFADMFMLWGRGRGSGTGTFRELSAAPSLARPPVLYPDNFVLELLLSLRMPLSTELTLSSDFSFCSSGGSGSSCF